MARRTYVPGGFLLKVRRSPTGLGMFAGETISKGSCIIEYVGRELSEKETETSKSKYLFEVTKKKTIDGKPRINPAGYINHSCRENAEAIIHKQRVFIFSIKNIKPGEEITYDYGKEYIKEHCTPCRCAKCMPEIHASFTRKSHSST
jgi:SET domain-containing protein